MASPNRDPQSRDDSGLLPLLIVGAIALAILAGVVGWGIGRSTAPDESTTAPATGGARPRRTRRSPPRRSSQPTT